VPRVSPRRHPSCGTLFLNLLKSVARVCWKLSPQLSTSWHVQELYLPLIILPNFTHSRLGLTHGGRASKNKSRKDSSRANPLHIPLLHPTAMKPNQAGRGCRSPSILGVSSCTTAREDARRPWSPSDMLGTWACPQPHLQDGIPAGSVQGLSSKHARLGKRGGKSGRGLNSSDRMFPATLYPTTEVSK